MLESARGDDLSDFGEVEAKIAEMAYAVGGETAFDEEGEFKICGGCCS